MPILCQPADCLLSLFKVNFELDLGKVMEHGSTMATAVFFGIFLSQEEKEMGFSCRKPESGQSVKGSGLLCSWHTECVVSSF